jgi:hypothetical protein
MIILGPVLPPKPKPKPKPKPHTLYGGEDTLYTNWDADFSNFASEEIEVFGYVENEGFALPEDGNYTLENGKVITLTDGIVSAFS